MFFLYYILYNILYPITPNRLYKSKRRNACIIELIQDCNFVVIHVHNMVSKSTIMFKKVYIKVILQQTLFSNLMYTNYAFSYSFIFMAEDDRRGETVLSTG